MPACLHAQKVMEIRRTSLEDCAAANDTVVVIDVLRAFSTAAYAFAAGAERILVVSTVEEAFSLRERISGSLIMGEMGGLPVEGFDYSNSPDDLIGLDLRGRPLIQRTSAGTQGVVRSAGARNLLTGSFCCATATASRIRKLSPRSVTFVISGSGPNGKGDEDAACADYIEALLRGQKPAIDPFVERVRESPTGRVFSDPAVPEYPSSDLEYCIQVDRFDFAMEVDRSDGLLVMKALRWKNSYR